MRALRDVLPPEDMPTVRTYTALFPDVEAGTVAIDFVIHGDEGVAGPWAAAAAPGDTLMANGPGGAYRPAADADWHLLVGDESALPAITAALDGLPEDARCGSSSWSTPGSRSPTLAQPGRGDLGTPQRGLHQRAFGGCRTGRGMAAWAGTRIRPR